MKKFLLILCISVAGFGCGSGSRASVNSTNTNSSGNSSANQNIRIEMPEFERLAPRKVGNFVLKEGWANERATGASKTAIAGAVLYYVYADGRNAKYDKPDRANYDISLKILKFNSPTEASEAYRNAFFAKQAVPKEILDKRPVPPCRPMMDYERPKEIVKKYVLNGGGEALLVDQERFYMGDCSGGGGLQNGDYEWGAIADGVYYFEMEAAPRGGSGSDKQTGVGRIQEFMPEYLKAIGKQ